MQDFNFHKPASVQAAVNALRDADDGKLLAGGQSLLPILKLGMAGYSDLVSLAAIPGLTGIERRGDALVIGAATTHAAVAGSNAVKSTIPALAALASGIGDPQVRNRGTLGGSIAHADPAADYPAAIIGLGATVHTDRRTIAGDDFFTGMFETALEDDEIITGVSFPIPQKAAYVKFPNPASKFAIVGVFVSVGGGGVRVGITGASPVPHRGTPFEQRLAGNFSPAALDGLSLPLDHFASDMHASAEYRRHLAVVIAKRAVAAC